MIPLDAKDKQLLFQLDVNCRQSNAEIGRKLGLSKEVVAYRIHRLEKEGIIHSFSTHIDFGKTGSTRYKLCIQLQNPLVEQKVLDFFLSKPDIFWVASCEGAWDVIAVAGKQSITEFNKLLAEFLSNFGNSVLNRTVAVQVSVPSFPRAYFIGKSNPLTKFKTFSGPENKIELSKDDLKLLATISHNARLPSTEIAKRSGLSIDQVNYKMKQLYEKEVILSYRLTLNYDKAEILYFKQFLTLRATSGARVNSLIEYCRKHSNIIYMVFCVGNWDVELDSEFYNHKEFNEMARELKEKFADIIQGYTSTQVSKEYRMDFIPATQSEKEKKHSD